jgi:signal transduction histidine kinase
MFTHLIIIVLIVLSGYLWYERRHLTRQLALQGYIASRLEYGRYYKELFENSSDAIFVIEVVSYGKFRFDSFNPAAMQIIDPDSVGIEGQYFDEVFKHSGDAELHRIVRELSIPLAQAIEFSLPVKFESNFRFLAADIQDVYEISLVPMADDSGISHVFCFAKNITAIKLYEQEVRERIRLEAKLSGFAASAPGFFYSFLHGADGSNAMPFASAGINSLFDLQPGDVAQNISSMTLLIHRDDLKLFFDALAGSAAKLSPLEIEFRTQHPDKGELWVQSRAIPIALPDGGILWHGFMHNITSRKIAELRLNDTQEKLRKLVLNSESERENERKHIAWEMHEELGQLLSAMKMRVYGMRSQFSKDIPSLSEDSRFLIGIIDKSIKTIHDLVSDLRPSVLQHGLEIALQWLVAEFEKKSGLECKLEVKEDSALISEELTTLVFRIVQEVLENVVRHSGVSHIAVSWVNARGQSILTIRHDGDAANADNSLSLFGIQERVTEYGGEVKIFSSLAHASVIEVNFSVRKVDDIQYPLF